MTKPERADASTDAPLLGDRKENGYWKRIRGFLQDHPAPLVWIWRVTAVILRRLRRPFEWLGVDRASRWLKPIEGLVKKPLFDCQVCGQCILHSTGMTCPMTCPKELRNGPCGGVRMNGKCEVKPQMDCVWVKAIERSAKTTYHQEIARLNPPVDWQLHKTASWVTFAICRDEIVTGSGQGPLHASDVIAP